MITTLGSHINRAIDYKNRNLYLCLSSSESELDSEHYLLTDVVCRRIDTKLLVIPSDVSSWSEGILECDNSYWEIVSESEAHTKKSRWVLLDTELDKNAVFDFTSYNVVGITSLPDALEDVIKVDSCYVDALSYGEVVPVFDNQLLKFRFILEF